MSNHYKDLEELLVENIAGKTVVVRCDLNVPLDSHDGHITDTGRIDAAVPTVKKLLGSQAKVVILSHLGRPDGKPDPAASLAPVAQELSKRLGTVVPCARDIVGQDALSRVESLLPGDALLLENVRFDPRETSKDQTHRQQFVQEIIDIVGKDAYFVSDGFGVVHRKQASVYDLAQQLPAYAGLLVAKETQVLSHLLENPQSPYTVILGGSKISDKLQVINSLAPKVDNLLIVGGMLFTFLAAQSYEIGNSLVEKDFISSAKNLLDTYPQKIHLPKDIVVADAFSPEAKTQVVPATHIPAGTMGLDIGSETVKIFSTIIEQSKTIFWNGPAGVFEMEPFSHGTRGIAEAIITATEKNGALSVIGGGDSAAAVRALGLNEAGFSHISTGGGASLEFLEGKKLPGLEVLFTT